MDSESELEWEQLQVELSPNNPRNKLITKYNPLSRVFFCWIDPLFWYGSRRTLQHEDLYAHPAEADSKYLLEKFNRFWRTNKTGSNQSRLWIALTKCLWWRFLVHGLLMPALVILVTVQSVLLGSLTDYFTISSPTDTETRDAYLLASAVSLIAFIVVVIVGTAGYYGHKLGMLVRIICTSTIYDKILRLSQSTISELTTGHIMNLATNDVHRFDVSLVMSQSLWTAPIHILLVTYFMYIEIGPSAFLATLLLVIQLPIQLVLAKIFTKLRLKAAKVTDERIKIMNEVITGIKVIKMYGWENAFHELVSRIRKKEINITQKSSVIRAFNLSFYTFTLPTMMFVVLSVYGALEGVDSITPRKVFTTYSLLSFLRVFSAFGFVNAVSQVSEGTVALKRIEKFLLLKELKDPICPTQCTAGENAVKENTVIVSSNDTDVWNKVKEPQRISEGSKDACVVPFIKVDSLSASWHNVSDKLTLYDISFTVNKNCPLISVVGAVGAGKSALLQCLLGELLPVSGVLNMDGTLAYVEQEPWIFSATLRDNILFGEQYNSKWYSTVLSACALVKDIQALPEGDFSVVGDRGITLSGGQKARVSFARAVYRKADIYLLDDPLSAVDAAVSRHIFDKCIRELLLRSSVVVLVTQQLQYVEECDLVLGLREGSVSVFGEPSKILKTRLEMIDISGNTLPEEDPRKQFFVRKHSFSVNDTSSKDQAKPQTMTTITEEREDEQDNREETQDEELDDDEEYLPEINVPLDSQSVYSLPTPSPHEPRKIFMDNSSKIRRIFKKRKKNAVKEDRSQGTVSYKTYYEYFKAGGGRVLSALVLLIFFGAEAFVVLADWWISDWSECSFDGAPNGTNQPQCNLDLGHRVGVYGGLVVSVWIACILRTALFYLLLLRATRLLHDRMFISVLKSRMFFFDTNPIGRILNRFAKDVGFLDDILIYTFCEFLQFFTRFLAIMLTAIIANPYMLISVSILALIFITFRWYYLKTACEVKRIEALARSPVYSHFSMTLQGLPTIRACEKQAYLLSQFHTLHNRHTQAWYAYIVASRWFGFRIDGICSIFVAVVAFTAVLIASDLNAGLVGLALAYAVSLTGMFQYCIRQSAEVESLMVSVERVLSYGSLDSEEFGKIVSIEPPPEWPVEGQIEVTDLSYQYSLDDPFVLCNVSCTIRPKEKIGIVGRTGAGKSSLVASFFRLAEPNGSIKIDGIECLDIGLHDLRPNISIIPQDPVLFSGSIRYNLDPFNKYDDEKIWTALKQVQLKGVVESLEGKLETSVSEGGHNFSVGQRQLFCLARALLKINKILMLDEATANVDLQTDAIIQQVIRDQFSECTMLTIAHRLDTVMDCDKIMCFRAGKLLEYGEPYELLCNPQSYLLRLVEHTGSTAAEKLKIMAQNAYKKKHQISDV